jgi:hypothetical protein
MADAVRSATECCSRDLTGINICPQTTTDDEDKDDDTDSNEWSDQMEDEDEDDNTDSAEWSGRRQRSRRRKDEDAEYHGVCFIL